MAMLLAMIFKGVLSAYVMQAILEMDFHAEVSYEYYFCFNVITVFFG